MQCGEGERIFHFFFLSGVKLQPLFKVVKTSFDENVMLQIGIMQSALTLFGKKMSVF